MTLQGKHNWPIGSSAILHNTFSLLWSHQMTSHLYRYLYKQGQLGGTVIDTLSTAVSGSLCWFLQFPEQLLYPVLHIYFQHYPWCFYYSLIEYTLFDIICYLMPYVCILFTNQLQYVILVHIPWCTVYVIYIAYIYETYTLVWTVTD